MATSKIHFGFGRIIVLLKRLVNSDLETFESLYMEAHPMLPSHLSRQLNCLLQNPASYEEDTEFLGEIIQELKNLE